MNRKGKIRRAASYRARGSGHSKEVVGMPKLGKNWLFSGNKHMKFPMKAPQLQRANSSPTREDTFNTTMKTFNTTMKKIRGHSASAPSLPEVNKSITSDDDLLARVTPDDSDDLERRQSSGAESSRTSPGYPRARPRAGAGELDVIKGKLAGFLPEEDTDDGGYESHGGGLSPRRPAKIASRFTFAPSRHAASLTPTASALTALPADAPPVPIARSLTQIPQIAPDNTVREFEAPEQTIMRTLNLNKILREFKGLKRQVEELTDCKLQIQELQKRILKLEGQKNKPTKHTIRLTRAIQEVDNKFDIYLKRIEDSADRRDQNTRFHMERVVERLQKLLTNQIDSDSERQRSRIEAVGLQLQLFERNTNKNPRCGCPGQILSTVFNFFLSGLATFVIGAANTVDFGKAVCSRVCCCCHKQSAGAQVRGLRIPKES